MKKIYISLFILIIVCPNVIGAYYSSRTGAYDEKTNTFYYDGGSLTYRSGKDYDSKAIYEYDFNKKTQKKYFIAENEITDLKMSPDSQMISFVEFKGDKNILKVINRNKKILAEINNRVQNYCWGFDSKKLYYITGKEDLESESTPIISDGVWMYDIVANKEQKIAEKGEYIRNVLFDNNIYFFNGEKTVRYNVSTNKVEEIDIKETNMTPNKRYYFYYTGGYEDSDVWESPYWSPFRIFDTEENQDLPIEKILFISERRPGEVMWARDNKTIIFRGNIERRVYDQQMYIYNFVDNKLIKTFKGEVFGMNHERTKLVVLRDGALFLESITTESGS